MTVADLFNDQSSICEILAPADRIRLEGDLAGVPDTPGAYLLGLGRPDPHGLYADAVAAGAALYAGSTGALRGRLAAHTRKLREVGLLSAEPAALVLPTEGPLARGWARLIEEALLAHLPLAWNHPAGPLWGVGANPQGRRRHAPAAPWWRVNGEDSPEPALVHAYAEWWEANKGQVVRLLR